MNRIKKGGNLEILLINVKELIHEYGMSELVEIYNILELHEKERQEKERQEKERQEEIMNELQRLEQEIIDNVECKCGIKVKNICACEIPKIIPIVLSNNNLYCKRCQKWKCRC